MAQVVKNSEACKPQSGWIPVEERLPDIGGYVPVTYTHGETGTARYDHLKKTWRNALGCRTAVIAWQPLPEPYVKPRRFVVGAVGGNDEPYEVWDTHYMGKPFRPRSIIIPTREAAEKIADIYEEAYRGK